MFRGQYVPAGRQQNRSAVLWHQRECAAVHHTNSHDCRRWVMQQQWAVLIPTKSRKPELRHSGSAGAVAEASPAESVKVLLLNERQVLQSPC